MIYYNDNISIIKLEENCHLSITTIINMMNKVSQPTQRQLEKIQQIAQIMAVVNPVLQKIELALDSYEKILPFITKMENYYSSQQWFIDKELSDKGMIPKNINEAALSEDGIWDILTLETGLLKQMRKLSNKLNKFDPMSTNYNNKKKRTRRN